MRQYRQRDVLTLGVKEEIVSYDFTELGWDAQEIVEFMYSVAFTEMVSRNVLHMWDWSVRVKNMLVRNKLDTVGKVMHIEVIEINKLWGCGFKSRKEIYDVFKSLNIELKNWHPNHYWDKYMNPKDEENIDRLQDDEE